MPAALQGECHTRGNSLFLPRASGDETRLVAE
jgi:hypothetical protein